MAEATAAILTALQLLGQALATEIVKEVHSHASEISSTFSNLEVRMKKIRSEFQVMQSFLDQMEIHDQSNDQSNMPMMTWLVEVQKVAERIKGILDEFKHLVGTQKFGGKRFFVKSLFKEPSALVALKEIVKRLACEEECLEHLRKIKERWVPVTRAEVGTSTNDVNQRPVREAVFSYSTDEPDLVGIDENKTKLTNLINSKESHLSLISVWGMGGIGKTTLVTSVFNREREHFSCNAQICISQNYKAEQVLRNLIYEICNSEERNQIKTDNMELRGLKEALRGLLRQRKYLIVLDDAWDQNSYQGLRDVFVDSNQGSRIIITTRNADVASLAKESYRLELKPLPVGESWKIFSRKAFQFERNHVCPPPLVKWAKNIVSKCNGLPLALVSLGSILSTCAKTKSEWKRVHDELSCELQNNLNLDQLRSVLILSFNYLPKHLKNCFLYCCMFPEDYLFARKKLIRLWIAEEFVEQRGASTLEETAEGYLSELINRSMLQVVKKNSFGRVKRCRMHDTLRELATSLCMKNNFCLLYEGRESINRDMHVSRLSIIKSGNKICYQVPPQQLRTLMSFDHSIVQSPLEATEILKFTYLTVLSLENLSIESVPDKIGNLFNLHYLGLRNTKVKLLPNSIEKLHNLKTLDLMGSEIRKLPDGIVKLKKLRHLFAETLIDSTCNLLRSRSGIYIPNGIFYLKDLQTLKAVESNSTVVKELGNLTQLRSFRIWNVKENESTELCRSLSKMSSLSYLAINASHQHELLQLRDLNLPRIQKLVLHARLNEDMLKSPLFQISGEGIQELWLGWSQLQHDPLPALSHLKNLTFLALRKAYEGQKLVFKAGWFPKLKILVLSQMPNLIQVEMEQYTMVSLEKILFRELNQLVKFPKGIERLFNLKCMICKDVYFEGFAKGTYKKYHFICQVV
ncbi:Disease resistance protein RPM1 [Rhynchospora pubera]|uniref:Disease resistance protein RPM1 n=1 Tax=Rhynchospora pubera TaxID=906938 RepID=A0AAV8GDL3_9POAL|nr:Disease resistance protein RPM1 [Rhynchospora pubera]